MVFVPLRKPIEMINANELRIGNNIAIPECGIQAKVKMLDTKRFAIDIEGIDLSPGENVFEYQSAEPIPLTPEVLEKCGFELEEYIGSRKILWLKNNFRVEFLANKQVAVFYTYEKCLITYLDNLHRLQNLYFALTGTELEYKP